MWLDGITKQYKNIKLAGCGQEYIWEKLGEGANLIKIHCKKKRKELIKVKYERLK